MTALSRLTTSAALALVDTYWTSVAEQLRERCGVPCRWTRERNGKHHPTCGWIVCDEGVDLFVRIDDADVWSVGLDFTRLLPVELHPTRSLASLHLYGPASRAYRRTQQAKWLVPKLYALLGKGRELLPEIMRRVDARLEYRAWRNNAIATITNGQPNVIVDGHPDGDVNALHLYGIRVSIGGARVVTLRENRTIEVVRTFTDADHAAVALFC